MLNESTATEFAMGERCKLYDDLKRYRVLRDLSTDEWTIDAIEVIIGEIEDRLAELDDGSPDQVR